MVEMQQARAAAQGAESEVVAEAAALQSMLAVFDSLNPETMLEMAQRQLGELVQLGVVVALGVSGKWHGLKHTMWPVAAAMVPGLAVSCGADESYYFTRSGAIQVAGVDSKIRDSGLAPPENPFLRLPQGSPRPGSPRTA